MDLAEPRIPKNVKSGTPISYGDDSTIMAIFSDEYVKNEYRSETDGKVVYDHFFQISLEYPGNNLSTFIYRFKPEEASASQWPQRFPRQWEAFKDQREQVPDGTPIEMWPPLDKKRVLELKASKIFTVEQIAGLTDMTGPNMGLDWRKLRDLAKATLEPNLALAEVAKVTRENEDLKNQMEVMQRQISALAAAHEKSAENLTSVTLEDQKPRRGRPPKQVETSAA